VPCLPAPAAGLSWFLTHTQRLDGNQKHTPNPCILSSCQAPFHGFLATTGAGTRSHRRSFLSLVPLMARYAAMLQWRLLPATAMLLLAAGAITFLPTHKGRKNKAKKHPKNNV